MKERYEMGIMDLYPVIANKTQIENNPFLQAKFREKVDVARLYEAVKRALDEYPLFSCTLRQDKGFYLEPNDADVIPFHADEKNRPLSFGDHTNGYLWQMCYDDCSVMFEWCHAVSDGRGGFQFFSSVLCHYFGAERPVNQALELGLESFYDKEESGIPQKKQEKAYCSQLFPFCCRQDNPIQGRRQVLRYGK